MYACGVLWASTCRVDASKMVDAVKRSRDAKLPTSIVISHKRPTRSRRRLKVPCRLALLQLDLSLYYQRLCLLGLSHMLRFSPFVLLKRLFLLTTYATLKLSNDVPKHSSEDFLREKWCSRMTPSCDSRNIRSLCPAHTTACSIAQERSHRRHVGNRQRPGGMS